MRNQARSIVVPGSPGRPLHLHSAPTAASGGADPHTESLRVGVAAPSAGLLVRALGTASGPMEIRPSALSLAGRLQVPRLVDVVVLTHGWEGITGGPTDLWDAARRVRDLTSAPIVVLGGLATGEPAPPGVVGALTADLDVADLTSVLLDVATGRSSTLLSLPEADGTVDGLLDSSPLIAALAVAVVLDGATSWGDVARSTDFSIRTVQGLPTRLADRIRADLDLPDDREVTQAAVFYWLGTNRRAVCAWQRRRTEGRQPSG